MSNPTDPTGPAPQYPQYAGTHQPPQFTGPNPQMTGRTGGTKSLIVALVIVGVVALLAVVIAVVAVATSGSDSPTDAASVSSGLTQSEIEDIADLTIEMQGGQPALDEFCMGVDFVGYEAAYDAFEEGFVKTASPEETAAARVIFEEIESRC